MGTHASKRGAKPHPVLMDLPAGIDIFVDGRLGAVGKLPGDLRRVVYRRKHGGRFDRLAMVDSVVTRFEDHSRRVYVQWRDCKPANVVLTHVASQT